MGKIQHAKNNIQQQSPMNIERTEERIKTTKKKERKITWLRG